MRGGLVESQNFNHCPAVGGPRELKLHLPPGVNKALVGYLDFYLNFPVIRQCLLYPSSASEESDKSQLKQNLEFQKKINNCSSCNQKSLIRNSLVTQWVKDLVLSLLWCGFDPWPRNFHLLPAQSKKKKQKTKNHHSSYQEPGNCKTEWKKKTTDDNTKMTKTGRK